MRKYLFVIALLIPFSLIAQVREHWLPDNSILKKNYVSKVFEDSKNRIWILNETELIMRDSVGIWHSGMQDSIPMYSLPIGLTAVGRLLTVYEDFFGNIILLTSQGVAFYNYRSEWSYYSKYEPKYTWFQLANELIPVNNGKLFFKMSDGFRYLQFEADSCKYSFDYRNLMPSPLEMTDNKIVPFLHDSMIIMHDFKQDIKYNVYSDVWTCVPDDRGIESIYGIDQELMKIHYTDNDSRFLLALKKKGNIELEIKECSGFIKKYSAQLDTHSIVLNLIRASKIMDSTDNSLIFFDNLNLYTFSESKGFMKLSLPDSVKVGSLPLIIVDIFFVDGNEIWLSGNSGIIKCDLQALLSTEKKVNTTTSVEINPHLPMMNIYRVYPQPNSSYVNFEYYMQSGLFSDIKVSVYDSFGKELKHIKYENIIKESIISTLRLNTTQFSAGVYIIVLDDGTNKASTKFIVEK